MRLIDADALPRHGKRGGLVLWASIEKAPTIKLVRHGRWEQKPDPYGFFDEIPVCSECGCTTKMRETYRYCPRCGAKMDMEGK